MRQFPTESDVPMHGWPPYSDMHRERIRAHEKHDTNGDSAERLHWGSVRWLPILVEEVGEVANVINELDLRMMGRREAQRRLREELVQVGAMAAAWVEAIDGEPE